MMGRHDSGAAEGETVTCHDRALPSHGHFFCRMLTGSQIAANTVCSNEKSPAFDRAFPVSPDAACFRIRPVDNH